MLGGIARLFRGRRGIGRHVRRFKHQVDDQVSRAPETKQEREPPNDLHLLCEPKRHEPSIAEEGPLLMALLSWPATVCS